MTKSIHRWLCSASLLLVAATGAAQQSGIADESVLPRPTLTRISTEEDAVGAIARIAGSGLGIGERKSVDAEGRELIWREFQRDVDQRGGVHVTYKQYLVGNGVDAELFGSGMAVHYDATGKLAFADGAQFEKVKIANRVRLSADDASRRSVAHVRSFAFRSVEREMVAADAVRPEVKLVQIGDTFRFAYFTTATDDAGTPYRVIFDAEDGRLLARVATQFGSNCSATAGTLVRANSIPVRPDVSARIAHQATLVPAGTRPAPFTHEGSWNYSGVKMTVFQYLGVGSSDPLYPFKCNPSGGSYTVFPVQPDVAGGVPMYRDRATGGARDWAGSAAGDALWHTYQTMRTFIGFGRKGWDNRNSPANIVVDYTVRTDQAFFNYYDGYQTVVDPNMPQGVVVGQGSDRYYSMASALDVIGHEWGHGVVFTTAGWAYVYNPTGPSPTNIEERALHEGWSDVIGMIVEKRRQPSGWGPEQRNDWTLHEDNSDSLDYARGAIDDGAGHRWDTNNGTTGSFFNDKVHRYDCSGISSKDDCRTAPATGAFNAHAIGNQLNVVHMLLADGGRNSACSRLGIEEADCPTMTGLGTSSAGLILFQSLQYRVRWWHLMPDLADAVKQEAFNQYSACSYDRTVDGAREQQAVMDAFANIGYPARTDIIRCP